ncbi:MAG: twin-arginine translocase TatA/TatE family subunit [Planctomycetaceae bacterium]
MLGSFGPMQMLMFATVALLVFGKRLPEVARGLGKSIVEFKKGIGGITDEVNASVNSTPRPKSQAQSAKRPQPRDDDEEQWTAPRFEPPTSEPVKASETESEV